MDYCGIILAKKHSERLPNKNFLEVESGKLVFHYGYRALTEILSSKNVYLTTDSDFHFADVIRPPAASLDNEPLWSALKWAYKSLPKRYDAIINIMANCPLHTPEGVKAAIERFEKLGCDELRSFNKDGTESGLMIVKEKYLLEKFQVSTYQAAINLESIEIHTEKDLDECKRILLQK